MAQDERVEATKYFLQVQESRVAVTKETEAAMQRHRSSSIGASQPDAELTPEKSFKKRV